MMTTRAAVLLVLTTNVLSLAVANPPENAAYVDTGRGNTGGYACPVPDLLNLVDRTCSANDACSGAERWPVRTTGSSTGAVEGDADAEDWSSVELYRTETLLAAVSNGLVVQHGGRGCAASDVASLYAEQSGHYTLRVVSNANAGQPYTVEYVITQNDAFSGSDVDDTGANPWFISAVPRSLDLATPAYTGSLTNRDDALGRLDEDWYRIGTSLAVVSDPTQTQGPAVGLLTVTFVPDCNGGDYSFRIYEENRVFQLGSELRGCGRHANSCITTGAAPLLAQFAVLGGPGTGYDFTADLAPLHLVDLNDGTPRPLLSPEEPWCDALVQSVVEAAGGFTPGTDVGLMRGDGVVVARMQAQ